MSEQNEPISPTSACADQAGTSTSSKVSTEDPRKTLRRMRMHLIAIQIERDAYRELAKASDIAASDLEHAISKLEREIEG